MKRQPASTPSASGSAKVKKQKSVETSTSANTMPLDLGIESCIEVRNKHGPRKITRKELMKYMEE